MCLFLTLLLYSSSSQFASCPVFLAPLWLFRAASTRMEYELKLLFVIVVQIEILHGKTFQSVTDLSSGLL